MDSMQARTKMFEMAKWLEESQNLLDWIVQAPKEMNDPTQFEQVDET